MSETGIEKDRGYQGAKSLCYRYPPRRIDKPKDEREIEDSAQAPASQSVKLSGKAIYAK